jgi:hypothetical protein
MQNDLMRRLVENDESRGAERLQSQHQERDSSYLDFLPTHQPVFANVTDPLEADSWLHTTESKFGLLHYTEYQRTLYLMNFVFMLELDNFVVVFNNDILIYWKSMEEHEEHL